jgi:chromosome segregation ATPase
MDKEVIELLIKAGEIFVLCLSILVVVWFLSRNQGQSNKAVVALAEAQQGLTKALSDLSETWERSIQTLDRMQKSTADNITALHDHDERVAAMRTTIDGAISAMTTSVVERNQQIDKIPGQVKAIMSEDIDELKRNNAQIVDEIKALRLSIDQRIEVLGTTIPERIIEPLKQEIAELTQKIDVLLATKPAEPPADVQPVEEPKPDVN